MRTIWTAVLSAAIALSLPALASGQTDVHGLEKALHGKIMGLRSYSADSVTRYMWVNGALLTGDIKLHGLEIFADDSVKLKGGKIVFQGNQETLVRNGTDVATAGRSSMTIEVDLQGADPALVIPQLQTAMFFPHLQDAIDGLPNLVSHILPYPIKGYTKPSGECNMKTQNGIMACSEDAKATANTSPPKILTMVSPEFTQDASDVKMSGAVSLVIHVTEKGRVDDVWIGRPMGYGLDQNAGNAAQQAVLQPAMSDGKPVEAVMYVEMKFETY